MTTVVLGCSVDAEMLLGDYLDRVSRLGLSGRAVRDRTRIARQFLSQNPDLDAWMTRPAVERAAELRVTGAWPLVCYAIGTDRMKLDIELAAVKQLTGLAAAVEARDPAGFVAMRDAANRLGWASSWVETVLGECLAVLLLACHGGLVADFTERAIDEFDDALAGSSIPPSSRRAYRARLASLRQVRGTAPEISRIADQRPAVVRRIPHRPASAHGRPRRVGSHLHRGLPGLEPHPRLAWTTGRRRRWAHRLGSGRAVRGAQPAQSARRHHRLGLGTGTLAASGVRRRRAQTRSTAAAGTNPRCRCSGDERGCPPG